MPAPGLRSVLLVSIVASLSIPATATPATAGPPIDLPRLPIAYDYGPPIESHGFWVGDPQGGEWRVLDGRLGSDDRLTLDIKVRPPDISVPLDSGPAVLFGRLWLYGGAGGDVGAAARVRQVVARVLPACSDPTDCVYEGSITLPTHRLPRLAERHRAESWGSAVISLTLVRTFAQGTWLQVLPLYDELDQGPGGRVGQPAHIRNKMLVLGASPVGPRELWSRADRTELDRIEHLRRTIDDPSALPETQPLLIDIATAPCTPGWTIATTTGDTLVNVSEPGPSGPVRVEAPVGAEWLVSVPNMGRAQGTGDQPHRFEPFRSDVPGMLRGRIAGDPYECMGLEHGWLEWHQASTDELERFPVPDIADLYDSYDTLPVLDPVAASLSFEHLWAPLDPADVPFDYVCEPGLPFTLSDLANRRSLDGEPEPLAAAIGQWGARISSGTADWSVVRQTDGHVLALAPGDVGWMESMKLAARSGDTFAGFDLDGSWDLETGGDCRAQTTLGAGHWRLDPKYRAPGPTARTLHVLGYLGCNGTEKAGKARVHTTDDAMLVAIPMRSRFNSDMCDGLGPTPMTIRLPKPLGDRVLYDAGTLPIRRIGPRSSLGISRQVSTKGSAR